jgi:hypothetical protein
MGGLVLPQVKTQHQHNNPPHKQQNHTHRTQLITVHALGGLGRPPVRNRTDVRGGVHTFDFLGGTLSVLYITTVMGGGDPVPFETRPGRGTDRRSAAGLVASRAVTPSGRSVGRLVRGRPVGG